MGYRLNRLDEPVFMTEPKSTRTEFDIHLRLESCVPLFKSMELVLSDLGRVRMHLGTLVCNTHWSTYRSKKNSGVTEQSVCTKDNIYSGVLISRGLRFSGLSQF